MRPFLFGIMLCWACSRPGGNETAPFATGEPAGTVSKKLEEASGLIASRNNRGYLWTLNDSGNPAEVFLIDSLANIQLTCTLVKVKNRDWEEIATGPGPLEDKNYLYVGDIGDNEARYPVKLIYRFEEPVFTGENKLEILFFDTLKVKLPDGVKDSEGFTIDPVSRDLFLFSKENESSVVYRLSFPFTLDTLVAEIITRLPIRKLVAADISANGQELLLKDYDHIFYWKRGNGETIEDLLKLEGLLLPYERERQGEAIAWALDGSGFYTLGETVKGDGGKLIFYNRNQGVMPAAESNSGQMK